MAKKRGRPPGSKNKKKKPDIETLLKTGELADYKIYQNYIQRTASGEILKPADVKIFHALRDKFEKQSGKKSSTEESPIVTSFKLAASYCDVSTRTISYHVKRGNITQNADGTFKKSVLDNWLIKSGRKKKPGAAGKSIDEKKEDADLRSKLAKAENAEIDLKKAKGELISIDEVHTSWAARILFVKMGLLAFKDRLPPMLEGKTRKQIAKIIEAEILELLKSYTEKGKYTPGVKN